MTSSIPIQNIYYMLSYAYKELQHNDYQRCGREEFAHIYDLLTAILIIGLKPLITRGLHHTYESHHDTLTSVRGKIDINGSMALAMQRQRALSCEFDEFSANNRYNQIIKSTIYVLLRQKDVSIAQKTVLKQFYHHFGTVDVVYDVSQINWHQLIYHQHNQRYRFLIHICKLIIDNVIINPAQQTYILASFVDTQKMPLLYEQFVREYYKYHYPMLSPAAPFIEWQTGIDQDVSQLPRMKTDIVLTHKARTLIIDTKYYTQSMQKHYDTYKLHSSNLYQMFTYLKNYRGVHNEQVDGLILYAKTNATVSPNTRVAVSGHMLTVTSLDLNVDFAQIQAQLNGIVTKHFDLIT
jgi:5-methylcytosine-specific restriction enzyme subunit McrC